MRSSEIMLNHFAAGIRATDKKDQSRNFYVAITCLRDCKETLEDARAFSESGLEGQYTAIHKRLEQLCLKASDEEQGQLRMIS